MSAKKPKHKQNGSRGNFALLVVFAVCVIALAVVFAISLAQEQMKKPAPSEPPVIKEVIEEIKNLASSAPEDQEALLAAMNFWPAEQFPSVPMYKASKYKTTVDNMRAEIILPAGETGGLTDYIQSLSDAGAAIRVKTDSLIVILNAGTEIQIRPTGSTPSITLCGEPEMSYKNTEYSGLILPTTGKLVSAIPTEDGKGAAFTYRNAAINDAMQYISDLRKDGWNPTRRLVLRDNTLLAYYTKGDLKITVDYFTQSDYEITVERGAVAENPDVFALPKETATPEPAPTATPETTDAPVEPATDPDAVD